MARTVGSAAEDTRQRILDTAADLFTERGYAGTSVRDISTRLGMTKGSLYYHFASKEDLLAALLAPLFDATEAFVAAARSHGGLTRDLVAFLVGLLDDHAPVLRSFVADPSTARSGEHGHQLPERFLELQRVLSGSADAGAMLRARCALAVIQAGVLAHRVYPCPPEGAAQPAGPVPVDRLSAAERAFVTDAAMAVMSVPVAHP